MADSMWPSEARVYPFKAAVVAAGGEPAVNRRIRQARGRPVAQGFGKCGAITRHSGGTGALA